MFTGIVQHLGTVRNVRRSGDVLTLEVDAGPLADEAAPGDSISVAGACLTVSAEAGASLTFDVTGETLALTTLANVAPGDHVNLESSLRPSDRMGGHFVTGHVDGTALVDRVEEAPGWTRMTFRADETLTAQMIHKGSVAVDGVSLTLTEVTDDRFSVALIPHTLEVTTLGSLGPGDRVNIETDLIGKWVRKVLEGKKGTVPISEDFLRKHGFA